MSDLEAELKQMIVEVLSLEDIRPEDISSTENLFDDKGLGLDSIDALEIGVTVQKKYGVKFDPQDKKIAENFANVAALANFIREASRK